MTAFTFEFCIVIVENIICQSLKLIEDDLAGHSISTGLEGYGSVKNLAEIRSISGLVWEFAGLIKTLPRRRRLKHNMIGVGDV